MQIQMSSSVCNPGMQRQSGLRNPLPWVLLFVACVVVLCGCAGTPSSDAAGADIVTDSDESDQHRRARIRVELAASYFEQGQATVALDEIKQALAADPGYSPAHNLRGLVYMQLNDSRQAQESFQRALALNPRDSDTLHNYGWFLCTQQRYNESMEFFARALANPGYTRQANTYMARGICYIRSGDRQQAEQSLSRAYELDPSNPIVGYNLSHLLFQRSELERSQFIVRRINNSELANAQTLWLGIKVEFRLKNMEAMAQLGEQLLKRYPQSQQAASWRRKAYDE